MFELMLLHSSHAKGAQLFWDTLYIALSFFNLFLGVHLRIKHGEWEVTDGTSCHSESELTDSLEMMKSTTNQQDQNSIANKIVKEKQVKLKGESCFPFTIFKYL